MVERMRTVTAARLAVIVAGMALMGTVPARAQFFWDQPRYSPDDIARIAMQHGFRPMAPPVRDDNVYLADVVDQRGRRERLVVNADSGEIMQRFFLDDGRRYRRYADPSLPRGPMPPGMIQNEGDNNLVTRLLPDDAAIDRPPPPTYRTDIDPDPRRRRFRRPRVVEQEPDRFREPPVESAPLAPPSPAPEALRPPKPAVPAAPQAALPPKPAVEAPKPAPAVTPQTPAADAKPGRPISHDPLAIPGSREEDRAREKAAAAAKPATPQSVPSKTAVPVVPLE